MSVPIRKLSLNEVAFPLIIAAVVTSALYFMILQQIARIDGRSATIASIAVFLVSAALTWFVMGIVQMFRDRASSERGELSAITLIGFALGASLFSISAGNIPSIIDHSTLWQAEFMVSIAQGATDNFEEYYHQMPCPQTTCNVDPTTYKLASQTTSTVLTFTPFVWGAAAGSELTFTDLSTPGNPSKYTLTVPRTWDTGVISTLTGYTGTQTTFIYTSGVGITAST